MLLKVAAGESGKTLLQEQAFSQTSRMLEMERWREGRGQDTQVEFTASSKAQRQCHNRFQKLCWQ